MGRSPCCSDDTGLKKGPWTPEEDEKLINFIKKHGHGSWRALPKLAGLNRCGKSCRLRWTNYLRPDIKRGKFSPEEEQSILNLHSVLGNKWSTIATHLPGRTDNEIKNYWNTHLKKKLIQMGFDPMTHRPRTDIFTSLPHLIALANLKEFMELHSWEQQALRLQNEASQMAKNLQCFQYLFQPPLMAPPMDTFNLSNSLSSMKDSSILTTPHLQNPIPSSHGVLDNTSFQAMNDSISFSHLPDLQAPYSFETSQNKDNMNLHDVSPWFQSSLSPPSPPPLPPMAQPPPVVVVEASSTANARDNGCSSSSFGGAPSSMWPDLLLEDPLFPEIE